MLKTCYIELNKIVEHLYRNQKNSDILQKMANNEVGFFDSTVNQSCANKPEMIKEYRSTIEIEYKKEIIETLKDKHKEYNMSCIKEKVLNSLEEKKKKEIGFR